MQVQQTSNVSFGMKAKFYGIRHALRSGVTLADLKDVRSYMAKLDPISSLAKTTFAHNSEKGFVVETECDGVKTDSDTILKILRSGNPKEKIPNLLLLKAMSNEVWLRINTGTK